MNAPTVWVAWPVIGRRDRVERLIAALAGGRRSSRTCRKGDSRARGDRPAPAEKIPATSCRHDTHVVVAELQRVTQHQVEQRRRRLVVEEAVLR